MDKFLRQLVRPYRPDLVIIENEPLQIARYMGGEDLQVGSCEVSLQQELPLFLVDLVTLGILALRPRCMGALVLDCESTGDS